MSKTMGVGVIGCGNISAAYFKLAPLFKGLEILACADVNMKAAKARAKEFKIKAQSVGNLLKNPDIDVIVNLTVPAAHYPVSVKALKAGKHVYSEKPLVLSLKEGLALRKLAEEKGLKVGCAPDTFLGGAHQLARKTIDDGTVGTITSGTAHVMNFGMEHWHPNPDFFYLPGGGPMLDLGPYYVANLINLIGPSSSEPAAARLTHSPAKRSACAASTPMFCIASNSPWACSIALSRPSAIDSRKSPFSRTSCRKSRLVWAESINSGDGGSPRASPNRVSSRNPKPWNV